MPFIYITGGAGSGKSTVQKELLRRGYEAYDEDDPSIGSAHNKKSDEAVDIPAVELRTPQWFSEHEYRVFPEALRKLKIRPSKKLVFLCGNVATEQQLRELFDKVVYLNIDEQTMRQRLSARDGNDFGKSEQEIQMILDRNKVAKTIHEKNKSVIIDASKSLEVVLFEILKAVKL